MKGHDIFLNSGQCLFTLIYTTSKFCATTFDHSGTESWESFLTFWNGLKNWLHTCDYILSRKCKNCIRSLLGDLIFLPVRNSKSRYINCHNRYPFKLWIPFLQKNTAVVIFSQWSTSYKKHLNLKGLM